VFSQEFLLQTQAFEAT